MQIKSADNRILQEQLQNKVRMSFYTRFYLFVFLSANFCPVSNLCEAVV